MPDTPQDISKRIALAWLQVQRPVAAYVASQVPDFHDADDVIQAVAIALIERFDTYDPARPLLQWALGIARHKIVDHYRRRGRESALFSPQVLERIEAAYLTVEPETDELRGALAQCLKQVAGRQRTALTLRYREELQPAAIGSRLGVSSAAASMLIQRGRAALRECVARRLGAEGGAA